MLARIRKAEDNDGGFTLIELLVVMIIIGILAAIAIPTFLSQKAKARESSAKSDVKALATEIEGSLTDGDPLDDVSITEVTGPTEAKFTVNGVEYTSRVTKGNKVSGSITAPVAAAGEVAAVPLSYCVQALTTDGTGFVIRAGQLNKIDAENPACA